MYPKKLAKPTQTGTSASSTSTWSSTMSRTLASALVPNNNKGSIGRRSERPAPVPYVYPEPPSSPRRNDSAVVRIDDTTRNVQEMPKSRSEGEYYNERYYQAQIAHLQTALVREHGLFVRVIIGFCVLVLAMLVLILYLFQRPSSCEKTGKGEIKWNVNIPILSPWTSTHEKEKHATTTTAAGWSFTTVLLLTSLCLLAWQNRNTMLKPILTFVSGHAGELRHLFSL